MDCASRQSRLSRRALKKDMAATDSANAIPGLKTASVSSLHRSLGLQRKTLADVGDFGRLIAQ
jgi:hypothetical protein